MPLWKSSINLETSSPLLLELTVQNGVNLSWNQTHYVGTIRRHYAAVKVWFGFVGKIRILQAQAVNHGPWRSRRASHLADTSATQDVNRSTPHWTPFHIANDEPCRVVGRARPAGRLSE